MSDFSEEQVLALIEDSLLLSPPLRSALRLKVISLGRDREMLSRIGTYLSGEKRFIVDYLKDTIRGDSTNLSAVQLRATMQREYVRDMRTREHQERMGETMEESVFVSINTLP